MVGGAAPPLGTIYLGKPIERVHTNRFCTRDDMHCIEEGGGRPRLELKRATSPHLLMVDSHLIFGYPVVVVTVQRGSPNFCFKAHKAM